nr:unnamed protein product [Digitaria exilis]
MPHLLALELGFANIDHLQARPWQPWEYSSPFCRQCCPQAHFGRRRPPMMRGYFAKLTYRRIGHFTNLQIIKIIGILVGYLGDTSGIPPNPITTRSLRKNPVRPTAVLASQSESRSRASLTHGLRPRCRSAPRRSTAPSPLRRSTAAVATGSLLRSTSSPDHAFKLLPPPPRAVSDRRLAAAAPSSSVW